jgi:hypothetical protein
MAQLGVPIVFVACGWCLSQCGVECGVVESNGGARLRGEIARDGDVVFVLSSRREYFSTIVYSQVGVPYNERVLECRAQRVCMVWSYEECRLCRRIKSHCQVTLACASALEATYVLQIRQEQHALSWFNT